MASRYSLCYSICLIVKVPLISNLLGFVRSHDTPIRAGPNRYHLPVDPSIVEQVLLYRHPALFLVEISTGLTASELYVEVSYSFVKNTSLQSRFDFPVPHCLWIKVKVFTKTARHDNPTS